MIKPIATRRPPRLLRYQDAAGKELADIIDMLTLNPEERRRVVLMLAEIDARS